MAKYSPERNPIENLLLPAPHVSQRCGAKARSTGLPCMRYASIGHRRCKFHGGASGSGRPQLHGRRSAQTQRNQVVVGALISMVRSRFRKPEPIEVPSLNEGPDVTADNQGDIAPQPPEQPGGLRPDAVAVQAAGAPSRPIN